MFVDRLVSSVLESFGVRLRESGRARRMSLAAYPPDKVEVVVPRGTSPARVAAFLYRHEQWIVGVRAELARHYRGDGNLIPDAIDFPSVGRRWTVRMHGTRTGGKSFRPVEQNDALLIDGTGAQDQVCLRLQRWLIGQGQRLLIPWVLSEGERIGLSPARVQIRLQRTRWGSCSAKRTISLNARALFLDPEIVRYLIVHELCHLAHMAHSRVYWRRVGLHEPDYRSLDKRLAEGWAHIPRWATPL